MEFKWARCSGILSGTAAALFLTDQSAHPSPRLWLQPCCQRSHSEGDAHTRTRRRPARLPYDRCKPSSIGRSPLHPRPATHAKSTSIPARAKSFEGTVLKMCRQTTGRPHAFLCFSFKQKNKKPIIFNIETNARHWLQREQKCVFLSGGRMQRILWNESPSGDNEAQWMASASLSVLNKI